MAPRVIDRLIVPLVALAAAILVVAVSVAPFLTSQWVAFEQERSQAAAWTGYTDEQLRSATDAILADLVVGPPDFDVTVAGEPVLNERERGHMRDVRDVFLGLWGLAAFSGLFVLLAARAAGRRRVVRAAGIGGGVLAVGTVVLGVVALVAFDVLFEAFHRLLFAGGTYTFDPSTERLVQLFPFTFWQESAMAVGLVIVVLGTGLRVVTARGTREPRRVEARTATAAPAGSRR